MRNELGQLVKGHIPWNKGKKGLQVAWNKGKELPQFSGKNHPRWKGFWIQKGYKMILIAPYTYVEEHRLVMEKALGRQLKKTEVVHHKDGNRLNNILSNLKLFGNNGEHTTFELTGRKRPDVQKYEQVSILPKKVTLGQIISLLPEYRSFVGKECLGCNKLFWTSKYYNAKSCSRRCFAKSKK